MGFLDILVGAIKVAGKALGIGDKVKEVVDKIEGAPPEVRAQIARDLQSHEQAIKALGIEELKAVMSESLAMIHSSDKFTSRARPALLYLAGIITAALAVAKIFGVPINSDVIWLIGPMWGQAGWYTYNRTKEKMNGGQGD